MKTKSQIFLITIFFLLSIPNVSQAIPIGPLKKLFTEGFDKVPAFFDDLFKKGKKTDEVITNNSTKNADDLGLGFKDQEILFNKISKEVHNTHLDQALNKSNKQIKLNHGVKATKIITKKGNKFAENLIDIFDFDYSIDEKEFLIAPYILRTWTGKIYQTSNYFNKPKVDKRMLLVCKNDNDIFYFTIILDNKDDINRAYLTDYKPLKNYTKNFEKQELLVLYDENKLKIMSTKPLAQNEFPNDYFIIHKNQFFKHDKYEDPNIIIKNNSNLRFAKNFNDKCYKAIKNGLLLN